VVYAAARRAEKMSDLAAKGARTIQMDVTNEASMVAGFDRIAKETGGVDILVNNAGYGSYGAIEDVPLDEARRQFEVNLFGAARLTQLVLPGMRNRQFGRIVNVSSMGGKVYTGFAIIEPGGITTPWGDISADNLRKTSGNGVYRDRAEKTAASMKKMYASGSLSSPQVVAAAIVRAVTAKRPKTRYPIGYMARPSILIRTLLGDRIFDRLITAMM